MQMSDARRCWKLGAKPAPTVAQVMTRAESKRIVRLPKPTLSGIQMKKLMPMAKVGLDARMWTVKGFICCLVKISTIVPTLQASVRKRDIIQPRQNSP